LLNSLAEHFTKQPALNYAATMKARRIAANIAKLR
jgi:hypothetical protein